MSSLRNRRYCRLIERSAVMTARARSASRSSQGVVAGADLGEHVACQYPERFGDRDPRGLLGQLAGASREPGCQIGDPLPIAIDLQHSRQPPQVRRNRLIEGQNPQALLLDSHLLTIRFLFHALDFGDQVEAAFTEGVDALGQRVDHGTGHRQEIGPQHVLFAKGVAAVEGGRCSL